MKAFEKMTEGCCFGATRYMAVVHPVTNFICEVLPEGVRETKPGELVYEDLEKLQPEDIVRLSEWLIDKVYTPKQYHDPSGRL